MVAKYSYIIAVASYKFTCLLPAILPEYFCPVPQMHPAIVACSSNVNQRITIILSSHYVMLQVLLVCSNQSCAMILDELYSQCGIGDLVDNCKVHYSK